MGALSEPCSDGRGLVGGIVVHDEMDIEILGHIGIDFTKELQEFLGSMLFETSSDDFAGCDVEGGKQRRRAMSFVIVSTSLGLTRPHRQKRLCPIKRLDLALFVNAQHESTFGRVEIKADDIPHLLDD